VPSQTCANNNLIPVPSLSPPFVLAVSADAGGARFTVGAYSSVGSIPAAISPCDATNATGLISPASLAHYAVEPCALLTFGDWEDVTGQEPSYSAALIASPRYGDCQWEMKKAGPDGNGTNTNFNLGEALIHEGSWALFEAEARALPGATPVHGLGQQAWCSHDGGPPTVAEAIIVELSPSWALAINAASCAAATYLARQAYDRLKAF
jgi:hypothetical protein